MAEALAVVGLVSSIVQFVDFGTKIIRRLEEFTSNAGDVPKTFRSIQAQLPLSFKDSGSCKMPLPLRLLRVISLTLTRWENKNVGRRTHRLA